MKAAPVASACGTLFLKRRISTRTTPHHVDPGGSLAEKPRQSYLAPQLLRAVGMYAPVRLVFMAKHCIVGKSQTVPHLRLEITSGLMCLRSHSLHTLAVGLPVLVTGAPQMEEASTAPWIRKMRKTKMRRPGMEETKTETKAKTSLIRWNSMIMRRTIETILQKTSNHTPSLSRYDMARAPLILVVLLRLPTFLRTQA